MTTAAELAQQVNKALGTDAVRLGSDPGLVVTYLPTGVLPIDLLLDGGIPRGRITEMYGDYSSLKSYVALRCIAETQAEGGVCALIDTEHSFDPEWAVGLGVDVEALLVLHPNSGEEATNVTEALLRSSECDLIVWDSVAATLPKAEHEKSATDTVQPARLAEFMSRSLRKLTAANSGKTALLFINQTRLNVGITFGSPESIPGGRALPFYASYRISMKKLGKVTREASTTHLRKSDDSGYKPQVVRETVAQNIRAELSKSKLSRPHREVYFAFDLEQAEIDEVGFAVSWAMEHKKVTGSGAGTWEWKGIASGRGRKGLEAAMRRDVKAQQKALEMVRSSFLGSAAPDPKKAGTKSAGSSKPVADGSTPARVRGASKRTAAPKKK